MATPGSDPFIKKSWGRQLIPRQLLAHGQGAFLYCDPCRHHGLPDLVGLLLCLLGQLGPDVPVLVLVLPQRDVHELVPAWHHGGVLLHLPPGGPTPGVAGQVAGCLHLLGQPLNRLLVLCGRTGTPGSVGMGLNKNILWSGVMTSSGAWYTCQRVYLFSLRSFRNVSSCL